MKKERFAITIKLFNQIKIPELLDKVSENILIANAEFVIEWINQSAKELLRIIGPFVQIENPEAFIGKSLSHFHSQESIERMKNKKFPYSTTISLFKRFKSTIVVDVLTSETSEVIGYILTWKDLTEFEMAIKEREERIKQLDTPIIGLANDTSVIVPIIGKITEERIHFIEEKVLNYCSKYKITDVLFDLSGVKEEITHQTAHSMGQMEIALNLMGVEPIYVGITPQLARSLVKDHIFFHSKTFNSFKQGVFYIWNKSNLMLTTTK